ncbi:MAG: hypothetical protein JSW11_22020 [Candidatus Heimdallarchaeota archaeon]|nr:MAG: hypothetical protein JSW11_22020 [Candidatus Heimdallarchaeota archaeon]
MIPSQLLFLSFILIIFILLILLALDIDFLGRLFLREESWPFPKTSSHENDVEDIRRQINLKVPQKNLVERLIRICPVEAITKSSGPEDPIIISETQCLGYSCRECLRLVFSTHYNTEASE